MDTLCAVFHRVTQHSSASFEIFYRPASFTLKPAKQDLAVVNQLNTSGVTCRTRRVVFLTPQRHIDHAGKKETSPAFEQLNSPPGPPITDRLARPGRPSLIGTNLTALFRHHVCAYKVQTICLFLFQWLNVDIAPAQSPNTE